MNPPLPINRVARCLRIWAITLWMAGLNLHAGVICSETFDSPSNTNLSEMKWKAYYTPSQYGTGTDFINAATLDIRLRKSEK